ncbi:MAG: phage holin family protein [Gammaproteobacteria bacterium]
MRHTRALIAAPVTGLVNTLIEPVPVLLPLPKTMLSLGLFFHLQATDCKGS